VFFLKIVSTYFHHGVERVFFLVKINSDVCSIYINQSLFFPYKIECMVHVQILRKDGIARGGEGGQL